MTVTQSPSPKRMGYGSFLDVQVGKRADHVLHVPAVRLPRVCGGGTSRHVGDDVPVVELADGVEVAAV
jgi:hypothetical protein